MQFLVSILLIVASVLLSALTQRKQKPPAPAALKEFQFPQVEEGTPQAVIFGQAWTAGWQVLWYGELATKKIKASGAKK